MNMNNGGELNGNILTDDDFPMGRGFPRDHPKRLRLGLLIEDNAPEYARAPQKTGFHNSQGRFIRSRSAIITGVIQEMMMPPSGGRYMIKKNGVWTARVGFDSSTNEVRIVVQERFNALIRTWKGDLLPLPPVVEPQPTRGEDNDEAPVVYKVETVQSAIEIGPASALDKPKQWGFDLLDQARGEKMDAMMEEDQSIGSSLFSSILHSIDLSQTTLASLDVLSRDKQAARREEQDAVISYPNEESSASNVLVVSSDIWCNAEPLDFDQDKIEQPLQWGFDLLDECLEPQDENMDAMAQADRSIGSSLFSSILHSIDLSQATPDVMLMNVSNCSEQTARRWSLQHTAANASISNESIGTFSASKGSSASDVLVARSMANVWRENYQYNCPRGFEDDGKKRIRSGGNTISSAERSRHRRRFSDPTGMTNLLVDDTLSSAEEGSSSDSFLTTIRTRLPDSLSLKEPSTMSSLSRAQSAPSLTETASVPIERIRGGALDVSCTPHLVELSQHLKALKRRDTTPIGLDGHISVVWKEVDNTANLGDMSTVSGLGNVGGTTSVDKILSDLNKQSMTTQEIKRFLDELSDRAINEDRELKGKEFLNHATTVVSSVMERHLKDKDVLSRAITFIGQLYVNLGWARVSHDFVAQTMKVLRVHNADADLLCDGWWLLRVLVYIDHAAENAIAKRHGI